MKILLIGNRGMLGQDIQIVLGLVHEIVGLDIGEIDIRDIGACEEIIHSETPEMVINAAAYTNVEEAESNREKACAINAEGIRNLAHVCSRTNIPIVHFSTDYVFDGAHSTPYAEDDCPHPLNVYGESKLQGERYLLESGADYLLVRTAWLYGKGGKNFVTTILKKAREAKELKVVNDQRGSPTYTIDLASALTLLIERGIRGTLHIANRGNCTWFEFARKILLYGGIDDAIVVPVSTDAYPQKALRPAYSALSSHRFTTLTGKTIRFWQIALKDFIERLPR
ncbi:MAG: dTDP-4-dehydrorhamnose reductase [Deltaproteobacteria bacterium]|nr:dTDP-4-dehydrorhamnose reductase [Deltaproteobacteria bacterium]